MTAHISEYYGIWLPLEWKSHYSFHDIPVGPSPRNCSGIQRGSAQVTGEREVSRHSWFVGYLVDRTDDDVWRCQSACRDLGEQGKR